MNLIEEKPKDKSSHFAFIGGEEDTHPLPRRQEAGCPGPEIWRVVRSKQVGCPNCSKQVVDIRRGCAGEY